MLLACAALVWAPALSALGEGASLAVHVYRDRNGNGARNLYDPGVAGVLIEVIPQGSETPVAAVTTDKDAQPVFAGLPAGNYYLRVTAPVDAGFSATGEQEPADSCNIMAYSLDRVQDSPVLTLAEGETTTAAIGLTQLAGISGMAWSDLNGDGIMQADEPGQSGVTITLTGVNNGLEYRLVTDDTGRYYMGQIKPGNYRMTVTLPEGTMFTRYSKTGGVNRSVITTEGMSTATRSLKLEAGDLVENHHIGVVGDGSIRVQCFLDANHNGLPDEGEAPLPGVKVEVVKSNGKTIATVTSGADGLACAGALRDGAYSLTAVIPEGYAFSCTAEGGNQFASATGRRKDTVKNIAVENGGDAVLLLGAIAPGSISGTAYLDEDFSGTMGQTEDTVSGLTVTLLDENGNQLAADRTNARGVFTFEGLAPGVYSLSAQAKAGYAFTKAGEGSCFVNLGDGLGCTELFTLTMGESLTGMDMGQIRPAMVQGRVFADANDNGLADADEAGLAGTVVSLASQEGIAFAAEVGQEGAFCFDAVMPGRYRLEYTFPAGGVLAAGSRQGQWFDLAAGDEVEAPLCGGLLLGEISGTAFADHNANGVQEEGEEPLPGTVLTLTPARSDLESISITTGEDGSFAITGLHPDTYTLTITMPEGYVTTRLSGLAHAAGEQSVTLTLAMGEGWRGLALGGAKPGSLRGVAWLDENFDGLYTEGEAVPAHATVLVVDEITGETVAEADAQEDGSFAAEGLLPGSYTLRHGPALAGKAGDSTFTYENGEMVMHGLTLEEGGEQAQLLLGTICHTSISGSAWVDRNTQVEPLAGAEVSLLDEADQVLATTLTDENGAYAFTGLMPGCYRLAVTVPEDCLVAEAWDARIAENELISVMTRCQGRSARSESFDLRMSRDLAGMDIGAVLPGTLGDLCWLDENANGLQDSGEGGIPGVVIQLLRDGKPVAETTTDQYGFYRFTGVYPAEYTLQATAPAQVKPATLRTDFPQLVSILQEDGLSAPVLVESGCANRNADLGFVLVEQGEYPAGYGQGEKQTWAEK